MDFMKLLKSLEEVLYELISWVVFYPLTLWRIVRHPLHSLAYAERQLDEPEDRQYDDGVSPPILLLISLGVLHFLGNNILQTSTPAMTGALADDRNLLAFRAVAFSLFPLMFGMIALWARKARITRATFKPMFYSQCYATVPFVITLSVGLALIVMGDEEVGPETAWGLGVILAGFIWYALVETLWLANIAKLRKRWAALIVAATLACAIPIFFIVAAVVGYAASDGNVI